MRPLTSRLKSFTYALRGLAVLITTQPNARIHAAATVAVCAAGFYFGLTVAEWCWIVLAMMTVWSAEAFNTALEFLADVVNPDFHPLVGKAKDVAAGAVLIAAIGAVVIGVLVFWPHVFGGARTGY
jgi:diacylglycerol kinase (ATP)